MGRRLACRATFCSSHVAKPASSDNARETHRHPNKPTTLCVDGVRVAPDFRRRGIAPHRLTALFAMGWEADCAQAWSGTGTDNLPARALYEQQGAQAEPFVLHACDLSKAAQAR